MRISRHKTHVSIWLCSSTTRRSCFSGRGDPSNWWRANADSGPSTRALDGCRRWQCRRSSRFRQWIKWGGGDWVSWRPDVWMSGHWFGEGISSGQSTESWWCKARLTLMWADLQTIVFPVFMDTHETVIISSYSLRMLSKSIWFFRAFLLAFTCAEGTDFNLH